MKQRGFAPKILMLPLGAALLLVVAAVLSATAAGAVSDGIDAIRLPSDGAGFADLLMAMRTAAAHGGKETRPWKCCDLAICTRSFLPICQCLDKVDRCSGACKECKQADGSRYTCADWYHGEPGPRCQEDGGRNGCGSAGQKPSAAAAKEAAVNDKDEERRPWRCCDLQVCTRSQPPICHCWDVVERCSSACKRCEEVKEEEEEDAGGHGRHYRCLDAHRGDPGPRCGGRHRHHGGTAMERAFDMILRRGYGY